MRKSRIFGNTLRGFFSLSKDYFKYVGKVKAPHFFYRSKKLESIEKEAKILPKGLTKLLSVKPHIDPTKVKNIIEIYKEAMKLPLRNRAYLLGLLYNEIKCASVDYAFLSKEHKMLSGLLNSNQKFKVNHFSVWAWPDGLTEKNVFVFSVKGYGKTAIFQLIFDKEGVFLSFIQGIKGAVSV